MTSSPAFGIDANTPVVVQRDWNGWRTAQAKLSDLSGVHWFQPVGAPRPLLHAFMSDGSLLPAELSEMNGTAVQSAPVLVCVLKCHIPAATYAALAQRADCGTA